MGLRFAVIGHGNRGRSHRKDFERLGEGEIECVAVCDARPLLDEEVERFGGHYYRDCRELLKKEKRLDFVVVASQEAQHVDHALACLRRGIPVYLEKAPSNTWRGAVRLYRHVKRHNYPLFIGYNLRRFPAARAAAEALQEGRIGKVQHVLGHVNTGNAWGSNVFYRMFYGDAAHSGDIVLAKLTHDTDWVQHALGSMASVCTASMGRTVWKSRPDAPVDDAFMEGFDAGREYTSHDVATVTGSLANGTQFTFVFTTAGPMNERRYVFNGSLGQLDVSIHNTRPDEPDAWAQFWRCGGEPETLELPAGEGSHGGADGVIRREFLGWLAGNPETPCEPESILQGMIIPTAGLDAAATGRTIDCARRLARAMGLD